MIRVVHFVHRIPPEYSGAGLQALRLIEALDAGHAGAIDCRLVTYAMEPARAATPAGIPTRIVPIRRGPAGKLRQYAELKSALGAPRADVLHVHGYHRPAVLFGRLSGRPTVLKSTMLEVDDVTTIRGKGWLDRRLVDGVDRVVSLSRAMAAANASHAGSVLIPNGVDLARFGPASSHQTRSALRSGVGVPQRALLFLHVGGDSERKGTRELPALWRRIRTALAHEDPWLLVGGRFEDPALAASFAEELGPSATIQPGMLDMPEWLREADILLFLSEREGLPNAVLEAVATDTFVFARDLPDTYDGVLTEDNSVLAKVLDGEAVRALEARVRAGAHRRVDNTEFRSRFGMATIAERYLELYTELSGGNP